MMSFALRQLALLVAAAACVSWNVGAEPSQTGSIWGTISVPKAPRVNSTLITLNDGEFTTYSRTDGSFAFHGVGPGVHLLAVHSLDHFYSQVKVQLVPDAMDAPRCIEYVYPGAPKRPIAHPLHLYAHGKYDYFEKRPAFNAFALLKNPMFLMMGFSVFLMVIMPRMMENLEPEDRAQMKRQMEMQQDPSKMLSQMWGDISGAMSGGGDSAEALAKKSSKSRPVRQKRE